MLTFMRTLRRRLVEDERGLSIVEVMVAMTIFAMIAAGAAAGIVSTLYLSQDNRARQAALNLASAEISAVRSDDNIFDVTGSTTTKRVGKRDFTVKRVSSWINSTGTDNTCGAGSGQLAYKRVNVEVSWASRAATTRSVQLDTLVAPPASVTTGNYSTIVVGTQTANGGPNSGVSVTITPNSGGGGAALSAQPPVTDADGCTYALNVTPGAYTVSIAKSGNITPDGRTSVVVSAAAGSIASKSFLYDQPATIVAQYATNAGTTAALPTGFAGVLRRGSTTQTITSASTSVFPYTDGWTVLGGAYSDTCRAVDPTTWPAANSLATRPEILGGAVGGTPGQTDTARVAMGVFGIKLQGSNTVLTATVKNTSTQAGGDPGCSPSVTYTFTGLSSTTVKNVALPYGTWTLLEGTTTTNARTGATGVSAVPTATDVTVGMSGNVVTLDPRTTPVTP